MILFALYYLRSPNQMKNRSIFPGANSVTGYIFTRNNIKDNGIRINDRDVQQVSGSVNSSRRGNEEIPRLLAKYARPRRIRNFQLLPETSVYP